MKKKLIPMMSIGLILILAFSATACEPIFPSAYIVANATAGGGNEASQVDVGEVLVADDGIDYLYILAVMGNWEGPTGEEEFVLTDWEIIDAHAHVAVSAGDIPQKKGNPRPGKFDLHYEDGEWTDDEGLQDGKIIQGGWMIELTQAMIDAGTVYIALHLEVLNDNGTPEITDDVYESVWANGTDFSGKNWATYFTHVLGATQADPA